VKENPFSKDLSRRRFLALAAGTAGAGALAASTATTSFAQTASETSIPLVYRTLGRTGLKITVVSYGAFKTTEQSVIEAAFDMGINFVDTARHYVEGQNEILVGRALKGYRDKVHVCTKVWLDTIEKMRLSLDESLAAMKIDYVDVFMLHKVESKDHVNNPEYRDLLVNAKKQGKAKFLGVSTHQNEIEVINAVIDDPDKLYDTILVAYNFQSSPELKAAIARAAQAGIGILVMKTQAGGYQTKELGDVSPHQAALKWVFQDKNITAAIPSMTDFAQLQEDVAVMGKLEMTQADRDTLDQYARAIAPYHCRRCGSCEGTCPMGVDIQAVNRCMMYAEGYRDIVLARSTYGEIRENGGLGLCGNCSQCTARCRHGLDLPQRLSLARETLC